jgi:hypothetical protein
MGSCTSSQGTMARIAPGPLAWSVALRASHDITIQASIEYVVCLPTFVSFICLVLRIGRSREHVDLTAEPVLTNRFPLGYWRNLCSSLDFTGQSLESCVDIIHVDIIALWNLYDKKRVSSPQLPRCFSCSTESVSVQQPIQDEYVSHRQRFGSASWLRTAEVSILHSNVSTSIKLNFR